jgi:8-oxo-dGTP pyrophosphatase MutT (NUDIX family)
VSALDRRRAGYLHEGVTSCWTIRSERSVYESEWVRLRLAEVELPDGRRLEHYVVRMVRKSVAVAVIDSRQRVLMIWRHRFITDHWGWELPAGWTNDEEDPAAAGRREVEEETGWRPGELVYLSSFGTNAGISDGRYYLYRADEATYEGRPVDRSEAARIEWIPLDEVWALIDSGLIDDGASLTALLLVLARDRRIP